MLMPFDATFSGGYTLVFARQFRHLDKLTMHENMHRIIDTDIENVSVDLH